MIKFKSALIAVLLSSVQQCYAQTPDLVESSQVNGNDLNRVKQAQLPSNPKVGLALGGGGARGAAEVGVMEVFEEEGIHFDIITGTSIGSIVGGLYVAGVPVSTLRKEFESGRAMKHFMPVPLGVGLVLEPLMLTPRLIGKSSFDGIYPGYSFRKYLEKITPEQGKEIRSLRIPYAAVCLNLTDGKPYMVRGGSLISAMVASSAVPGLRRPVPYGEKLLCDGGVACNVPVKQCREMGADIVIAVNIDEPFSSMEIEKFRKLESVSKRMLAWDLYTIDKPQEELADVVIHPDTLGVSLITTNRKCAVRAIEAGRQAALKALPEIKKKLADAGIVVAGKANQISATGSSAK